MTPEWSQRAGNALASPYWSPSDWDEFLKRRDEMYALRDAIYKSDSYDDLEGALKESFDRAEAAEKKARAEYEEFAQNDTGGYGRFHETW